MTATPFKIEIPDAALTDLRERLQRTRWPTDLMPDCGWKYGTNNAYLKELCGYWANGFDWRAQEASINRHDHFLRDVDGFRLHYIHAEGQGPDPLPLVFTHGWPSTFYDFDKIIEPLADPGAHGGDPADAFDVIVPSMPGYAFSERPTVTGYGPARIAELWDRLLTDMGHDRYGAHGGDWGGLVTGLIGWKYPERVVGIHRLVGGIPRLPPEPGETDEERRIRLADGGGYGHIQSTRPQTLAYGLTDSPAGLAGWIVEKWHAWSDCGGDIESRFTKVPHSRRLRLRPWPGPARLAWNKCPGSLDAPRGVCSMRGELLTTISLYWFTETIYSSTCLYHENAHDSVNRIGGRIEVPSGYAVCRWLRQTRDEIARESNLVHWTEFDRGAHFSAFEEPEMMVDDIRKFFRPLR